MTDRLKYLLDRDLKGNMTPEEREELDNSLLDMDNDAGFKRLFDAVFDASPADTYPRHKSDILFEKIVHTTHPHKKRKLFKWYWVAAAFAVLVGSSMVFMYYKLAPTDSYQMFAPNEVKTAGRKDYVILPDSSMVTLNKDSRILYDSQDHDDMRVVTLEGEAFFDVKRDEKRPFIVKTAGVETRVLGTKFNINVLGKDAVEVTVQEGSVQVQTDGSVLGVVKAGQQFIYDKKTDRIQKSKINILPTLAWRANDIIFNDATVEEVFQKLEQRFEKVVVVDGQLENNKRMSTVFFGEETLDEVLTVVCAFYQYSYRIEGNQILIIAKQDF